MEKVEKYCKNLELLQLIKDEGIVLKDSSGEDYVIYSMNSVKGTGFVEIQHVRTGATLDVGKQSILKWYNNRMDSPFLKKQQTMTFNSKWLDDCVGVKGKVYKRWKKLQEKVLIFNPMDQFNSNPEDYVEPDWLVYSKFAAWVLSQDNWENMQIRGDLLLGKKVFDIDSIVFATYSEGKNKTKMEIKTKEEELDQILWAGKQLEDLPEIKETEIPLHHYITYVGFVDNTVLYVGSGVRGRQKHLKRGSHSKYLTLLQDHNVEVKHRVVFNSPEKVLSLAEETRLIRELKPLLNTVDSLWKYSEETLITTINSLL